MDDFLNVGLRRLGLDFLDLRESQKVFWAEEYHAYIWYIIHDNIIQYNAKLNINCLIFFGLEVEKFDLIILLDSWHIDLYKPLTNFIYPLIYHPQPTSFHHKTLRRNCLTLLKNLEVKTATFSFSLSLSLPYLLPLEHSVLLVSVWRLVFSYTDCKNIKRYDFCWS